jgi:RNA polymerase sigma factor (sigma-70 family)
MSWDPKSITAKLRAMLRKKGQRKEDAEDLAQEALLKFLLHQQTGDQVQTPEGYLAMIIFNLTKDKAKHEARVREHAAAEDPQRSTPGPHQAVEDESFINKLRNFLDGSVGERARKVFFSHVLEGMTMREIGRLLNITPKAAAKDIARCRDILSLNMGALT